MKVVILLTMAIWMNICQQMPKPDGEVHKFSFKEDQFIMDDQPFYLVAGEIHYARIPVEYWRHRIQMIKAMGCNALSVYIFQNYHNHQLPIDSYDFTTENKNLSLFLSIAQEEEMWVLIRPGPYVCGEWDAGGHPWWLLKDANLQLRSTDPVYMEHTAKYVDAVAPIIQKHQCTQGGNIIMLQIENEYGYIPKDPHYMQALLQLWEDTKLIEVPYYHADPASGIEPTGIRDVHIDGLAIGINPGIEESYYESARQVDSHVPIFSSETWLGWYTHWGDQKWGKNPTDTSVAQTKFNLENGYSLSIYMAIGGTSWGFWSGANFDDEKLQFQPDVTSYDYDSPINEAGQPTEKYNALRELISGYVPWNVPEVPAPIKFIEIPVFKPKYFSNIWANLEMKNDFVSSPLSMEQLDQDFGLVVYQTRVAQIELGSILVFDKVHDFAWVYVDNVLQGTIDRREKVKNHFLRIKSSCDDCNITIVVEGMGRINFGKFLMDQKGLIGDVWLNYRILRNWNHGSIRLDDNYLNRLETQEKDGRLGNFYRWNLQLEEVGDSYLNVEQWGKGMLWVNGKNLGRYWNVGPQYKLYCPGVWLKKGDNEIVILDLGKDEEKQIWGELQLQ